jgi:hypothetical protein
MHNVEDEKDLPGLMARIWGTGRHANKNISCFLLVMVPLIPIFGFITKDATIFEKSLPIVTAVGGFVAGFFDGRSHGLSQVEKHDESKDS